MSNAVELRNIIKEFPAPEKSMTVRAVDDVSIEIYENEFFALLGPSGCGKTTTLRLIAGFEEPSSGEILIRGQAVQNVPPFHRPVNTVFQDYALFPHMTVIDNIMFGLRMEKVPKSIAVQRAKEALDMVQLPQIANRKPRQLSGGQQQRVALARALVKEPAVLLLDEPLGALDLKLRKQMQYELKSIQNRVGITFIYVTHDQEEALTMADRIAVMSNGKALQIGAPREIYEQPKTRFVADFIGETNFLSGVLEGHSNGIGDVRLPNGTVIPTQLPESDATITMGEVTIPIRPERVGILPETRALPQSDTRLVSLTGFVTGSQYIGTDTRYTVKVAGEQELVVRSQNADYAENFDFRVGESVQVFWALESSYVVWE